jgi:hypothetical protein
LGVIEEQVPADLGSFFGEVGIFLQAECFEEEG